MAVNISFKMSLKKRKNKINAGFLLKIPSHTKRMREKQRESTHICGETQNNAKNQFIKFQLAKFPSPHVISRRLRLRVSTSMNCEWTFRFDDFFKRRNKINGGMREENCRRLLWRQLMDFLACVWMVFLYCCCCCCCSVWKVILQSIFVWNFCSKISIELKLSE